MSGDTKTTSQPIVVDVSNIQKHLKPDFILKQDNRVPKRPNNCEIKYVVIKEEPEDEIPCEYCTKTFCNEIALTNHIKMHHASALSSDSSVLSNITYTSSSLNESYKKIAAYEPPLQEIISYQKISNMDKAVIVGTDGSIIQKPIRNSDGKGSPQSGSHLVTLASEDVSYIIIKTEGVEDDNLTYGKRQRRSDAGVRRSGNELKPQVELTGPFECLQPSNFLPQGTCHQIFFNCCEYSIHYREEHTKRRKAALRCQVCEKRLDQDLDPKSGVFSMPFSSSADQSVFSCSLCGKAFKDSFQMDDHMKSHHIKLKPFQCKICMKRFTQQGGLQQHMRMHTGDRPFPCTFCDKSFTQKAGLDQHLRIHTKIKPFRCVVCSKSFSQSVHLRQHMRTHTNIQPFECGVCGKRFKQSSHLNFHLRCHSNDTDGMTEQEQAMHKRNVAIHQKKLLNAARYNIEQDNYIRNVGADNVDNLIYEEDEIIVGDNGVQYQIQEQGSTEYVEGEERDGVIYVQHEEQDGIYYQEAEEQDGVEYQEGEEQDGTQVQEGTTNQEGEQVDDEYQEGEEQVGDEYQEGEEQVGNEYQEDDEQVGVEYQEGEEPVDVEYQEGEEPVGIKYEKGEEQDGIQYQEGEQVGTEVCDGIEYQEGNSAEEDSTEYPEGES